MTEMRPEEGSGVVFQPDTLLPSQFFAALREKGYVEGEKRLLAAVLADAVECFMKQASATDSRGYQLFGDAAEWIFNDYPGWFFSFSAVCHVLGLEPEYVRRGLREWIARKRPGFDWSKAIHYDRDATHRLEALKKAVG